MFKKYREREEAKKQAELEDYISLPPEVREHIRYKEYQRIAWNIHWVLQGLYLSAVVLSVEIFILLTR